MECVQDQLHKFQNAKHAIELHAASHYKHDLQAPKGANDDELWLFIFVSLD